MERKKLIYLIYAPEGADVTKLADTLLKEVAPALVKAGSRKLVLHVPDAESQMKSPAPKLYPGRYISAMASLFVEYPKGKERADAVFAKAGVQFATYLVEESIYTEYGGNRHSGPRDWPDGRRSPGITAVTLMERPQKIAREEWIRRWHGTMSPVSEAIQPRTRYVRNLVIQPLTGSASPFEGIVAENWPSKRHVTNPFLFYGAGNPVALVINMVRILRAVTSFLSLRRIQTVMLSEYFIQS